MPCLFETGRACKRVNAFVTDFIVAKPGSHTVADYKKISC